jgi:hypothetical protein
MRIKAVEELNRVTVLTDIKEMNDDVNKTISIFIIHTSSHLILVKERI